MTASLTKEQMDEQYQNGLTVLQENKKLGLLTQDQYDNAHAQLVKEVYGLDDEEHKDRPPYPPPSTPQIAEEPEDGQ